VCGVDYYYSLDATATSDRVCHPLSAPCEAWQIQTVDPTPSSDRQCQLMDFCASQPCANGDCSNVGLSYQCTCASGWIGVQCDVLDYCTPNPCKNGATCTNTDSGPLCTCTDAFCGDCCAQLADGVTCFGGTDQQCAGLTLQQTSGSSPVGTIAGAALGGFVGLILVVVFVLWVARQRYRRGAQEFGGAKPLAVYTVDNPIYGELSHEDTITPNYLRCVAFNTWRSWPLVTLSDDQLMNTHDLLGLQRPAASLCAPLREHTMQFLDTVVPLSPMVIADSLIDEAVNFLIDALPDVLLEVALDVLATGDGKSVEDLYEQYYTALLDIGAEYEAVGDGNLYNEMEGPFMNGNSEYIETNADEEPFYNLAITKPNKESPYSLAAGRGGSVDPLYSLGSGSEQQGADYALGTDTLTRENPYAYAAGSLGGEGEYAMAAGSGGYVMEAPYSMAGHDNPMYLAGVRRASDADPVYSAANGGGDYEPTYSLAGAVVGDKTSGERTYARATDLRDGGDDEPTYSLAGALGGETNDADAEEPVYDMSDDTA